MADFLTFGTSVKRILVHQHQGEHVFRAVMVAAVIAATTIGAAASASADSALEGGIATTPGPFLECPAGTYQATSGDCVESPDQNPQGATAICRDGTDSHSEHRSGTCSGHGGVDHWLVASHRDGIPPGDNLFTWLASHGETGMDSPELRQKTVSFADSVCSVVGAGVMTPAQAAELLEENPAWSSARDGGTR